MSTTIQGTRPRQRGLSPATAATIEDVEFLAKTGADREEVATRTGYRNWTSLERLLRRNGRHDLIRQLPASDDHFTNERYRAVTR